MYQHLREIEWMPTPEQVVQNLPHVFKERYPSTFLMDLKFSLKPLVISRCSHLRGVITCTITLLVACTPNGAVSYISPVFVGGYL